MSKIFPKCGIGTKKRYKKIQKDMIFVPMPYYGISIGHIYNKKAGLQSCCSANRGSGIAFVTNSNTVAHAVYIIIIRYVHACAYNNIHL